MTPGRRRLAVAAVLLVAAAAAAAFLLLRGDEPVAVEKPVAAQKPVVRPPQAALPSAPKPAFAIPQPKLLQDRDSVSRWSPVLRRTTAFRSPDVRTPVVGKLETQTPEETTNLVLVLDSTTTPSGEVWAKVRLPVLPNNTVGWIPRRALGGYTVVATHLVIDRARLRATLYSRGRSVFNAPVGIGESQWPTPGGKFYIRNKLTQYANPFYGPLAFGTSARSAVLTDWPAGGFVGIHGTNQPDLIPGRISHGCVRMRNGDILRLARIMPIGTPLTVL